MRKAFSKIIEEIGQKDESIIVLTGDLGFNALENTKKVLGDRFINMGVAEQNMISVAAGMAYKGYKVFCYSIAPFIVYRALEQVRNDVCFHNLPVFLVGNGGGYGYGIMGPTHHAINDLGTFSGLPNMKCWIPAFSNDLEPIIERMINENSPAYLRLGLGIDRSGEQLLDFDFDKVLTSKNPEVTVIVLGPLIENVLGAIEECGVKDRSDVFSIVSFPTTSISDGLLESLRKSKKLLIVEEHVEAGGVAQNISLKLMESEINPEAFRALNAKGYPGELYGSQKYHQKQSGLDKENIIRTLKSLL